MSVRAGLIAVPVDFTLGGSEIEYIAQSCQARAFIVQHELVASVDAIRSPLGIPRERWVHFGSGAAPAGWSSYETLIAEDHPRPDVHVCAKSDASCPHLG